MKNFVTTKNNGSFFDSLLDNFFEEPMTFDFGKNSKFMKTDVIENEKEYQLAMDLPGFLKEQIEIELDGGYITITAKKEEKKEDGQEKTYLRRERCSETIKRSFYIGEFVTEDEIEAKLENGTLFLTIPKKKPEIPEKKTIMIK